MLELYHRWCRLITVSCCVTCGCTQHSGGSGGTELEAVGYRKEEFTKHFSVANDKYNTEGRAVRGLKLRLSLTVTKILGFGLMFHYKN